MIYKLAIQSRHFRINDKLCLLSGLISAHGRESWVGVTICLLALQNGEVTIIMQSIVDTMKNLFVAAPNLQKNHKCKRDQRGSTSFKGSSTWDQFSKDRLWIEKSKLKWKPLNQKRDQLKRRSRLRLKFRSWSISCSSVSFVMMMSM